MMEQLAQGLRDMGREVGPAVLSQFETYRDELLRWNERTNLTAITAPLEVETRHFLDSLTVLQALEGPSDSGTVRRIIDIGSGAGLPGIPLKLMLPEARLTLLEATGKKVAFLRHMVSCLELSATEVVYGRAEEVAHVVGQREAYDIAVARAVAPLATLAEICLPFVAIGGMMVALKKGSLNDEIENARAAVRTVGGAEIRVRAVALSQLPDQRVLICIRKASATPSLYPRRPGVPFKRPLSPTGC
jgi:16S rRNA (guanine527-N7)-methyltransferase